MFTFPIWTALFSWLGRNIFFKKINDINDKQAIDNKVKHVVIKIGSSSVEDSEWEYDECSAYDAFWNKSLN